jgi:hypothetical protein
MFYIADDGKCDEKLLLDTSIRFCTAIHHCTRWYACVSASGIGDAPACVRRAVSVPSVGKPNAKILKIFREIYSSD